MSRASLIEGGRGGQLTDGRDDRSPSEEYLARAPVTHGTGPEAVAILKRVMGGLYRECFSLTRVARRPGRHTGLASELDKHWSPRCDPPWNYDTLERIAERIVVEVEKQYDAEEHKAALEYERGTPEQRARRAAAEQTT